jgi:hypothetical protein
MNWLKAWLLALSLSIFLTQVAFGTFDMKFGATGSKESTNNYGIGIYLINQIAIILQAIPLLATG